MFWKKLWTHSNPEGKRLNAPRLERNGLVYLVTVFKHEIYKDILSSQVKSSDNLAVAGAHCSRPVSLAYQTYGKVLNLIYLQCLANWFAQRIPEILARSLTNIDGALSANSASSAPPANLCKIRQMDQKFYCRRVKLILSLPERCWGREVAMAQWGRARHLAGN